MPSMDEIRSNEQSRIGSGLDRLIDRITESWFHSDYLHWPLAVRFFFTLAGSSTFMSALFTYEFLRASADRAVDPLLLDNILYVLFVLAPLAIWFAFLTSFRATRAGPTWLYLSGFLLPASIWGIINYILGSTQ